MKKICFLDRDGVIIHDMHYLKNFKDIHLTNGIIDGLNLLKKKNYVFYVISNQSGVGRGIIKLRKLKLINKKIISIFKKKKIDIKEICFCPCHPDASIKKYKKNCFMRKPNPGIFLRILKKNKAKPENCISIGDRKSDIQAGKNAGLKKNFLFNSKKNFKYFIKKKIKNEKLN